ncbi:MAG: T9SS type A sorting domain-containing protein [Lewinellaceae bacterium]|nr:T9SS type A sorting domain-containing protein [Lewinellaceae bacterium]
MRNLLAIVFTIAIGHCLTAQNILVGNSGLPNEPSIMMDYNHPNVMVAAANINKYYLSQDTGRTWTAYNLSSSYGVWGDPALDVDPAGNFYFFHLSNPPTGNWIDRIVCQKSQDGGQSWNDGSFTGLNGTKAQDKQWSAIDRNNGNIYLTWTQFDDYGSSNPADSSIILFSKSTDGGANWSQPLRINSIAGDCIDSDNTVEGATPAVGPNGEVYVSWAGPNGIVFNRSTDQGNTWLSHEIPVDPMPGGWDHNITSIQRANGLPITRCDLSGGPHHGTIYINWADQRNGFGDTDIWLAKSTDGGNTWSGPVRINDDPPGKQQFFPWMAIDQTNGYLYFVFYDRRHYAGDMTDVYIAYSQDGGNTFVNKRISESPFLPTAGVFFGDYTNIVAHNNIVRPIWTRLHNGQLSIWTDVTPFDSLTSAAYAPDTRLLEVQHYPNPASDITYVSFKLHGDANVSVRLYDNRGQMVHTVLPTEKRGYGSYVVPIRLNEIGLPPGEYYCRLDVDNTTKTLRMIVIE